MDKETQDSFDKIYNTLAVVEIQCDSLNGRVDAMKHNIRVGHILLLGLLISIYLYFYLN